MNPRELKFRVWDEKHRCWEWNMFIGYPDQPLLYQGRIFQQFTGMIDSKKKEIYEGDIVEMGEELGIVFMSDVTCGWCIEYKRYDDFDDLSHFCAPHRIEVVGNIFETPELLK